MQLDPALYTDAVCPVLETMFFTGSEPVDSSPLEDSDSAVRVRFSGSWSGAMCLRVSRSAAAALAAAFLAREPECSRDVDGVMAELANMLCGSLLSQADPIGEFQLEAPEPCPPQFSQDWRSFATEDGFLHLQLTAHTAEDECRHLAVQSVS